MDLHVFPIPIPSLRPIPLGLPSAPGPSTCLMYPTWAGDLPIEILNLQFSSVTQSFPTLCDHMNRSMPRLAVPHQLLEFTQTHVHQVGDAIQSSHPLSSPSPPAPV